VIARAEERGGGRIGVGGIGVSCHSAHVVHLKSDSDTHIAFIFSTQFSEGPAPAPLAREAVPLKCELSLYCQLDSLHLVVPRVTCI
jgi:hypothetical protein